MSHSSSGWRNLHPGMDAQQESWVETRGQELK